jgi:hypothetical protein
MLTLPAELKNFYQLNKEIKWKLKKEYSHPADIFSDKDVGWIKLQKNIENIAQWKHEATLIEKYYVKHRTSSYDHQGWLGCCLHGLSVTETEFAEDGLEYRWTELYDLCPSIVDFWKRFPVSRFKRLRFMKLEPRGYINVHNDLPSTGQNLSLQDLDVLNNTVAINLSISQPADCNMIIEGAGIVPWNEGDIFIINNTKNHCVVNNSDLPRIHMIAECVIGDRLDEFLNLVNKSIHDSKI